MKEKESIFLFSKVSAEIWDQASGQNHVLQVDRRCVVLIACYSAVRERFLNDILIVQKASLFNLVFYLDYVLLLFVL